SSSLEEEGRKYKTEGYESSLEEIMKRFTESEDSCGHNKNVHRPIESMIRRMRLIMNKMRQGVLNKDSTNSEDHIQKIITENIALRSKNVELQRKISASRKNEEKLEVSIC
ncbi:hypothetical protein HHI36_001333, partial [Cryptolaemus montrouzieri]